MTTAGMQYRIAVEGGVRDVDESKRQVLVSFPWETLDSYKTDFSRDCFDDFLRSQLPIMCWQHIRSEPIGRAKDWQKTAKANDFVAGFSDFNAVPRSLQAFTQIRDGELTDFSYGFNRAESTQHPDVRGAIRFTRAGMPEISPVSVGSIPGAVAVGIRAEAEVANIRGLVDAGAISEDEATEMIRAAGLSETPSLGTATLTIEPDDEKVREALRELIRVEVGALSDELRAAAGLTTATPEEALVGCLERAAEAAAEEDWATVRQEAEAAALFAEEIDDGHRDDGTDNENDDDQDDDSRAAISDKPWSEFSESDYTPEQYRAACLIVTNDGATKDDFKLPVKEPDGALNRNGIHAAAEVLAGGRGGVDAPQDAKVAAAKRLVGLYGRLNEDPPKSLVALAGGSREADYLDLRADEAEALARLGERLAG